MFNVPDKRDFFLSDKLEIKKTKDKGLGVFAKSLIKKNMLFESCHVVVVEKFIFEDFENVYGAQHLLKDYVFLWQNGHFALALGYGSIYNHSNDPNAAWYPSFKFTSDREKPNRIEFKAIKDIHPGEEICTHYSRGAGDLFFADDGSFHRDSEVTMSEIRSAKRK